MATIFHPATKGHFGGLKAVDDISLTIRRNTVHALIGPNGSGRRFSKCSTASSDQTGVPLRSMAPT